ncbi:hypothetical protein CWI37_0019p0020 [Hamiltosporidium tvaerminnensis]|uniref:Uncharacterized protein n=3 Tax=Hamiltosporidium TaxID=1176354 RepID=A0A4Q9LD77_9MICR|nr:hypothetical protein CWI37_0019p0020 [Hamiltosporidium tvaerminnensis]
MIFSSWKVIILFCIAIAAAQNVVIIKGKCGVNPADICKANGYEGVVANGQNIPYLMEMLNNNKFASAGVSGWNDHLGNFVLRNNGSLAPFEPLTNNSEYAFCVGPCPCPERPFPIGYRPSPPNQPMPCPPMPVPPMPCPPMPCPPMPCPPMPCPPMPCPPMPCPPMPCPPMPCPPRPFPPMPFPPMPCPPMPCPPRPIPCPPNPCYPNRHKRHHKKHHRKHDSCSSSSSSSSSDSDCKPCHPKKSHCPSLSKKHCKVKKGPFKCKGKGDVTRLEVDKMFCSKTFIYNPRELFCGDKIKVREIVSKNTNVCKDILLQPLLFGKHREGKLSYPALLRFPCFLIELIKALCERCKIYRPCLYIDKCNRLYVLIHKKLYCIKFMKNVQYFRPETAKCFKLVPISRRKTCKLIQSGLYGIVFDPNAPQCCA